MMHTHTSTLKNTLHNQEFLLKVDIYICVFVYVHVCLCMYMFVCVCVYMHTHIQTHFQSEVPGQVVSSLW